ncbi:cell division protein ZapA [Candidatus Dependentiae bacterium]|nr:cell division protein ZapA [Candidatus Dependentiae bacterium]MCC7414682.1 cell division protein ZapA [Campylobacterota bacterium]
MTNEKKRYKVTIFGQEYTLISSEHDEYLLEAAHLVDTAMKEIASKTVSVDQSKVAVMAALHMASSLAQARSAAQQQEQRCQALVGALDALFV